MMNRCRRAFRAAGNLGRHVVGVGELLVVQVAAFLRQHLILDMDGSGAGILEAAHHVHHVQRFAVAGIAVHQQRQSGGARDLAHEEAYLVDGDHAEVGNTHRGGHRGAGQVEALEPRRLRLQARHAVMRAGHLQDPWPRQQCAKPLAGGSSRQIVGNQVGHGAAPVVAAADIAQGRGKQQAGGLTRPAAVPPGLHPALRAPPGRVRRGDTACSAEESRTTRPSRLCPYRGYPETPTSE